MSGFPAQEVYKKAENLNAAIVAFLKERVHIDSYLRGQLRMASMSVVINIAEGNGKSSRVDQWNFYTTAREFVHVCIQLFRVIKDRSQITEQEFPVFCGELEDISTMLLALINSRQ